MWPRLLRLQERFPNLKIDLRLASSADVHLLVQGGQAHFGLATSAPKAKAFEVAPAIADPAVLVQSARTRHRSWLKRPNFEFVTYRAQDPFTARFLKKHLPKKARGGFHERAVVNSHIAMIRAITENDWLAVMPRSSVESFAKEGEIDLVLEERNLFGLFLFCPARLLVEPAYSLVWADLVRRTAPSN